MTDNAAYTLQEIHDFHIDDGGYIVTDFSASVGWAVKKVWHDEEGRRCTSYLTDPLPKDEAMIALMRIASGGEVKFTASATPESSQHH